MVGVVGEFDLDDLAATGAGVGREFAEEQAEFAIGGVEALGVEGLDANELVNGDSGFRARGFPVEELADAAVDAGDLLEEQVVTGGAGEVVPVGLEQAQVVVDGGDGDLELVGDVLEGVSVLPELVFALHAPASSG